MYKLLLLSVVAVHLYVDGKELNSQNSGNYPCGQGLCSCSAKIAFCSPLGGRQLHYIPPLPQNISTLHFKNNNLPSLTKDTFKNISDLQLSKLFLRNNRIINISVDVFSAFANIEEIALDGNSNISISQLSEAFGSIHTHANVTLWLTNIGLSELNTSFFQRLSNAKVVKVCLDQNGIKSLNFKVFETLNFLQTLSLKTNLIREISVDGGHKSLQKLVLSENEIARYAPRFCSTDEKHYLFPNLRHLDLNDNFITELNEDSWSCLYRLEYLGLSGNSIKTIKNNVFSSMKDLLNLDVSNMRGRLHTIEKYAFNNSRLLTLNLALNSIVFQPNTAHYVFQRCKNLQKLYVSHNKFDRLNNTDIMQMFGHLSRLKTLSLVKCRLSRLPVGFLKSLTQLNNLHLEQNRFSSIGDAFQYASRLKTLTLQSNNIRVIKEGSFPMQLTETLTSLNLELNPFDCTCDMLWFRTKIGDDGRIGNMKLVGWPRYYQCSTPSDKARTKFIDYRPTESYCKNVLLIVVLCVSSILMVSLILSVLSYKYRWYIALSIYKMKSRMKNPERRPLLAPDIGHFHGYVIYDLNDEQFVHHDLRVLMEEEQNYKLHIWERDGGLGGSKLEDMVDSIYASEYVIAVVSKKSITDSWIRFQVDVALDRQMRLKRDFLILVLLEDINVKALTKYWCVLMAKWPVARWCTDESDVKRKVFEQQITQHFGAMRQHNIQ